MQHVLQVSRKIDYGLRAMIHLAGLPAEHHRALWGVQEFYRVFSLVSGGRARESDLFEGLR